MHVYIGTRTHMHITIKFAGIQAELIDNLA